MSEPFLKYPTKTIDDTLLTNESEITINSSLADHYSNDSASSHDSQRTIATLEDCTRNPRAVTQDDIQRSPDVLDLKPPSEYSKVDICKKTHKRQQSRCSVISTRSYDSSASNYDLLLARLGPKSTLVPTLLIHKDEDDWEFWSTVISDYNSFTKSQKKTLSRHVQKGIPSSLRGMIWPLLASSQNDRLQEHYLQLIDKESVYEKAIIRDISKSTLLDHDFFKGLDGQEVLFNVVKAYSIHDTEIGYNQAILHIAAPLVLNLPEEEAFGVLVQLLNKYNLRGHFLYPSTLLIQRLYQLEGLAADNVPRVQRHLTANGVRADMYAYPWFLSLFSRSFPLDVVYRIYDVLLLEGVETLFQFAIALLDKNNVTILGLRYNELVTFLNKRLIDVYKSAPDQLVKDALKIQINPRRLDRLAKDFRVKSTRRSHNETKLMTCLKQENKLLSDTILRIQKECDLLNSDHTNVAAELVSRKMEMTSVHEDNEKLRQQCMDLETSLETLPIELEARAKKEINVLYAKNKELEERNAVLENQLAYMESLIIEIKGKYLESEREKEKLEQTLIDMKHLIG